VGRLGTRIGVGGIVVDRMQHSTAARYIVYRRFPFYSAFFLVLVCDFEAFSEFF